MLSKFALFDQGIPRALGPGVLRATRWAPGLAIAIGMMCAGDGLRASLLAVPDEALARLSAAAVRGRVVDITSRWDAAADTIYTFIAIDVNRSWGLHDAPVRVVVKQLGGAVGETALFVGGQARFDVGEDVFVLLDVRPRDRTLSVAGFERGKWTMSRVGGQTTAVREHHAAGTLSAAARDVRTLRDLESLAALAGTKVRATDVVIEGLSSTEGRGAPAYVLLTPSIPARWHEADSGTPVYVDSQSGGHPLFPAGGVAELVAAAARWSAAGSLRLQPGTYRGPRCFSNAETADGRISVTYGDPCDEIADASSTVAIGGAYYSSSDVRTVNGVAYWKITKGMVVTDNVLAKFSGMSTGCWDELMTHELGHAIGLGHAPARPSVMFPSISPDCASRTASIPLSLDDIEGVSALYPPGFAQSGPPGPPRGLSATVSGSAVTLAWLPPVSGAPPTTYQLQAGSVPGAADHGTVVVAQTSFALPHVGTGVYYVRAVATNAFGASVATPDITVIVGQGLPGMPWGLLAAAGPGGSVFVQWQPPATGGTAAGYTVPARYGLTGSVYQIPVAATSLTGNGVLSGAYFVRVVAVNSSGTGPVSPEISVVVP